MYGHVRACKGTKGAPWERAKLLAVRQIYSAGFTVIELLITIAIAVILASTAIPSFRDFMFNNRAVSCINEFVAAANIARDEAVKRGAPVTVCSSSSPQANNPTCDGGQQWESGWILFADYDRDANMDLGAGACLTEEDCLLHVWDGFDDMTLRANPTRITFDSTGASQGFQGTWRLCDARGAQDARAVVLSPGGRVRTAQDTDGDGIPEDGGGNISCP